MNSRQDFREHGTVAGMPRRMRALGVSAGEWLLLALLCAAIVGLFVLGAAIDEPVNPQAEELAAAERAELDAAARAQAVAQEQVLAQGARP